MTISSETRRAGPFNGNDVTTSFPFTFKVFDETDIQVIRTMPSGIEAALVLDSDYSVTLNPDQDASPGGTITYPLSGDPLAEDWKLTAIGALEALQPTDLTNQGGFYPQVIENGFDRLTILVQQLAEELGRTIRIAVSDPADGLELPAAGSRPDRVLGFDADGNLTTYPLATATLSAAYQSFTATEGQELFTLPFSYAPGVNALYVFLNGVKLMSGADYAELSSLSFALTVGAQEGDVVEAITGIPLDDNNIVLAGVQVRFADTYAAAVALAASLPDGATVIAPDEDGIQTRYVVSSGALTSGSRGTSEGVEFTQSGVGAVPRSAQEKMGDIIDVRDFGAVGDGSADDTDALQAAIDRAAALGGGTVHIPTGTYKISATLLTNKGVLLKGAVRTDISSNTNGGGVATAKPCIVWDALAPANYMYAISPAVVGDCVWGGGAVGIEWNGSAVALGAVVLDNTKYAEFDGKVRDVTFAGVIVSSTSGSVTNFSMKNHIRSLEFVWGVAAACQNADGLQLSGNGSTVPATQQLVGDVSGLVYNGSLVRIAETDNAQFQSVHGVVQAGGTGAALRIINAGAQPSNHNVFFYTVGPVAFDGGLVGNTFINYNSEGGGISQLAGASEWHGELIDYVTGERFKSRTYALRDEITVAAGSFIGDAATALADVGAQWRAISFPDAVTSSASLLLPAPYDLAAGVLESVQVIVSSNGTSAGNYRLALRCSTASDALSYVTPEKLVTQTFAAGAQYVPTSLVFDFSPELDFVKGDVLAVRLQRLGADGADTNTDAMQLIGARLRYRSTGPASGGSGTYTIPNWT